MITLMYIDRKSNLNSISMVEKELPEEKIYTAEIPEDNIIVGIVIDSQVVHSTTKPFNIDSHDITDYERYLFTCSNISFRIPAHYFRLANTIITFSERY